MRIIALLLVAILSISNVYSNLPNRDGFSFQAPSSSVTMKYKKLKNLIVVSAIINDSLEANLILDSGFRNMVLFGKRFERYVDLIESSSAVFSGLGEGKPVEGKVSVGNRVELGTLQGKNITIVVVPQPLPMIKYAMIDGVIGYDVLSRFEMQINPFRSTIRFRPAEDAQQPIGDYCFQMELVDVVPVVKAEIQIKNHPNMTLPLVIDTGSQLALLLKEFKPKPEQYRDQIGYGLNGAIFGKKVFCASLNINGQDLASSLYADLIHSPWATSSSLGMGFLKDYIFTINYVNKYLVLSRPEEVS